MTKKCSKCGVVKSITSFYRAKENRDGYKGRCKSCVRVHYTSEAYRRNKASHDRAVTKWRQAHPERAKAISHRSYHRHPDIYRLRTILRSKRLTLDQYHSMFENQDFLCFLCRRDTKLHVDHDHKTGRNRRLLCRQCNTGLGSLQDNPALLRAAAAYVERFRCAI